MGAAYSPHRDVGGILHFPSPSHIHHVDPASALRQLRRSLSRSPSKGPTFRLVTSKSASPSPGSPLSPSPLSPHRDAELTAINSSPTAPLPSPLAIPFPPSAKKGRASIRKLSPMRSACRSSSTQRNPIKRGLSDSTDHGNATPPSLLGTGVGIENRPSRSLSPEAKYLYKGNSSIRDTRLSDSLLVPYHAFSKFERENRFPAEFTAKSSPLKRSDGIMNLDQASLGSPSAKRRSLHGASFGPDFNIFDHEALVAAHAQYDICSTGDRVMTDGSTALEQSSVFSPLPRRTSSLRKTTLQQRHEKPSFARSKPNSDLAQELSTPGPVASKGRSRMSLETFLPPANRDSPFASQGSLPNASMHPIFHQRKEPQGTGSQAPLQKHPLSRTMTQSSSGSSLAEDSPTHIPLRQPEPRRPFLNFSKSLPVGGARPDLREPVSREQSSHTSSTETSFATPDNYKLAKPLPAAFMSTGLISKRNKNMDISHSDFHESTANMPDTPCKRSNNVVEISPGPVQNSIAGKARHNRHSVHSFGTPSTPFNPHTARPGSGTFGKGTSIFGSSFTGDSFTRRGSFISVEGDDFPQPSSGKIEIQSSTDFDLSPTPSKQSAGGSLGRSSGKFYGGVRVGSSPNRELSCTLGTEPMRFGQSCKSTPERAQGGSPSKDSSSEMEDSPVAALRFKSFSAISSYSTRSHLFRHSHSPTPLSKKSLTVPYLRLRNMRTKSSPLSPASPLREPFGQMSPRTPHTPQESVLPPDPSGLSISAHGDVNLNQSVNSFSSSASVFAPATPTTSRDYFPQFGKRSSTTPVHSFAATDIDPTLTSRFDTVEMIGTGEFSQVYRVSQKSNVTARLGHSITSIPRSSPKSSIQDQVWAVKRSRNKYIGPKDRSRKLQEVEVLKMLGRSDHTIQLFNSWEHQDHLYIQTEFCEEGSLDIFLEQAGRKARLDDFRIWKILLELSLGLKHIHDCGFIHLDLKPANVLITFEGVLKIGDFGMATSWPAPSDIEGEGDREYIGPEILMGRYDKPADIFALGLIMLEIAGNVMLPDNGASWQRLRTGDMSDVPSLTWSSEASNIFRDSSGKPLSREESFDELYGSDCGSDGFSSLGFSHQTSVEQQKPDPQFQLRRSGELATPPNFMIDQNNDEALDKIVRWMISPQPADRPIVDQILAKPGVQWAEVRRRAGATIFEGNWGPADEVLADDAEMIDV